jgi:hypothetical protein
LGYSRCLSRSNPYSPRLLLCRRVALAVPRPWTQQAQPSSSPRASSPDEVAASLRRDPWKPIGSPSNLLQAARVTHDLLPRHLKPRRSLSTLIAIASFSLPPSLSRSGTIASRSHLLSTRNPHETQRALWSCHDASARAIAAIRPLPQPSKLQRATCSS